MTKAEEIRKFVAEEFRDVGKFQTKDVMNAGEQHNVNWTSSHVGAALHTWVEKDWIIEGYRINKTGDGRSTSYTLVSASAPADSAGEGFYGEILESTNGNFLVRHKGQLYKVTRFKW